ncbi:hypothetical protein [Arthrobacter sp. DR-2P]|nr:hypothetical protein [Arthrobacter sp. DR-2P]
MYATYEIPDRTGTRNRNQATAGGRPTSQGLEPAHTTPE